MISLFFSYCHKDEELRNELEIHLTTLKRQGIIEAWHDRRIVLGQEWASEISEHLEQAQVILLLVSPYFIASDYCYDIETKRAIERHEAGKAKVIPVILEHCNWHRLPFGRLQATPKDGKPVSKFANRHEALTEVTQSIQTAIEDLNSPVYRSTNHREKNSYIASARASHIADEENPTNVRSSNMRLKKTFSDYEKDQFLKEALKYMTNYFQNSLQELEKRNPHIKADFHLIDANSFEATIYVEGKQRSRCGVRLETRQSGGHIVYTNGGFAPNTYSQMLTVAEDGYILYLSTTINVYSPTNQTAQLTYEGGSELFWSYLLKPMQD